MPFQLVYGQENSFITNKLELPSLHITLNECNCL